MTRTGINQAKAKNRIVQSRPLQVAGTNTAYSFLPVWKALLFFILLAAFVVLPFISPAVLQAKDDTSIVITTSEEEARAIRDYLKNKGYTIKESNGEINAWYEPPVAKPAAQSGKGSDIPALIWAFGGIGVLLIGIFIAVVCYKRKTRYSEYDWEYDYDPWGNDESSGERISLLDRLPSVRCVQETPSYQRESVFNKYAFCNDSHQFNLIRQQYSSS